MYDIVNLSVESLVPYSEHPFKEYTGKRLEDMVKSVTENGVLVPIIVRSAKTENSKFEILSGHNRVNAAREAGLSEVPAIVRDDLNDDEARLIVTETNLIQRSFADLSHSEKAEVIGMHYSALKQKGRHKDLIKEIEEILSPVETKKTKSIRDVSGDYGLNRNTVARYLRINKLIPELKARLDGENVGDKLSIRTAVSLSYLRESEQKIVDKLLSGLICRINMKKAETLRTKSEEHKLSVEDVKKILDVSPEERQHMVKINEGIYSRYFNKGKSSHEISEIIEQALEAWFERQS